MKNIAKKQKNNQNTETLHLIFEILSASCFLIGLFPFAYYFIFWFLIPITVINFIFSVVKGSGNVAYDAINILMSILGLIPIIGAIPRIVGVVLSSLSIFKIYKDGNF